MIAQVSEKQNNRSQIRPKVRKRNNNIHEQERSVTSSGDQSGLSRDGDGNITTSSTMVDELLEKTRKRLDDTFKIGHQIIPAATVAAAATTTSSSRVGLLRGLLKSMDDSTAGKSNDKLTVGTTDDGLSIPEGAVGDTLIMNPNGVIRKESTNSVKVKGILKRETKYQNEDNRQVLVDDRSMIRVEENHYNHEKKERKDTKKKQLSAQISPLNTSTLIKGTIVERLNPQADLYPNEKLAKEQAFYSTQVEGYIPKQKIINEKEGEELNLNISEDIINITSLQQAQLDDSGQTNVFETDMEFKCMTDAEFKSAVEVANALGMSVNDFLTQQQEVINNEKKEIKLEEEANKENIDTDVESCEEEEDDDDFFSFFGPDADDGESVDSSSNNNDIRPSSFMILWRTLSNWITPKSINVLMKYRCDLFDKDHQKYNPVVSEKTEFDNDPYLESNHNDVAASRCEGLMSMIKMNLSKALAELNYNCNDEIIRQQAYMRLGDFIQSFDFTESMVKFDSIMWLALTVILLDMLLPERDIIDDEMPATIIAVGISSAEYTYLIKTAVPTLSKGASS